MAGSGVGAGCAQCPACRPSADLSTLRPEHVPWLVTVRRDTAAAGSALGQRGAGECARRGLQGRARRGRRQPWSARGRGGRGCASGEQGSKLASGGDGRAWLREPLVQGRVYMAWWGGGRVAGLWQGGVLPGARPATREERPVSRAAWGAGAWYKGGNGYKRGCCRHSSNGQTARTALGQAAQGVSLQRGGHGEPARGKGGRGAGTCAAWAVSGGRWKQEGAQAVSALPGQAGDGGEGAASKRASGVGDLRLALPATCQPGPCGCTAPAALEVLLCARHQLTMLPAQSTLSATTDSVIQ